MRGDGRIFQREGSPYWWAAYYRNGKEIRESTKRTNEDKARKFLKHRQDELAAERLAGKPFPTPSLRRVTVGDLLDSLEADYKLTGKGDRRYHFQAVREAFAHRNGKPLQNIRKAWELACVCVGLGELMCTRCGKSQAKHTCEDCKAPTRYSGLRFHDLRRSAVRNLVRAGVPEQVAMSITGHRTRAVFDKYCIANETQKEEALQKT